jgi:archaellum biogenesis protein FlaJ (TadC family)
MASVRVWSKVLATIVTLFLSLSFVVILILVTALEASSGRGNPWFLALVILVAVLAGAVGAIRLIWESPAEDGENAPEDWYVI